APTLTVADVLRGFGEQRYTAGHPDGRHAFVTDAERGEVIALDVLRGRVLGREHVGARARHVTIDPSGRRLWIALGSKAEQIAIVDVTRPSRPRLVRLLRPPFLAHDVAWTPDGRMVWVSSGDRNELALYRVRTLDVVARPPADWPPQHVTFRGARAYVTSGWNGYPRASRSDRRPPRRQAVARAGRHLGRLPARLDGYPCDDRADREHPHRHAGRDLPEPVRARERDCGDDRPGDTAELAGAGDHPDRGPPDSRRVHLRRVGHQAGVDRRRGEEQEH